MDSISAPLVDSGDFAGSFFANGDLQPYFAKAPLNQRTSMRTGTKQPPMTPPTMAPVSLALLDSSAGGGGAGGSGLGDEGGSGGGAGNDWHADVPGSKPTCAHVMPRHGYVDSMASRTAA